MDLIIYWRFESLRRISDLMLYFHLSCCPCKCTPLNPRYAQLQATSQSTARPNLSCLFAAQWDQGRTLSFLSRTASPQLPDSTVPSLFRGQTVMEVQQLELDLWQSLEAIARIVLSYQNLMCLILEAEPHESGQNPYKVLHI